MEQKKRNRIVEVRRRIATRQRKTEGPFSRHAEIFRERDVSLDRVRVAIDRRDPIVKPARAFARVAHSVKLTRTARPPDEGAAQQALEIERRVRSQTPGLPQPRQGTKR